MSFDFKQCPKCRKTFLKALGFGKGKRQCLRCEGKPSGSRALEDA